MAHRTLIKLEDAFKAIKEIQERIVYYDTDIWDFHRRRITNAHPSIDDYDYVVRKELKQSLEETQVDIVAGKGTANYWKGFRAILPLVPTVAADVMDNRYRVDIPQGKVVKLAGIHATSKIDPSTGDFSANILRSDDAGVTFTTIFNGSTRIKILNGEHRGETTDLAITTLALNDELRIDILSNGAASGIEIVGYGTL